MIIVNLLHNNSKRMKNKHDQQIKRLVIFISFTFSSTCEFLTNQCLEDPTETSHHHLIIDNLFSMDRYFSNTKFHPINDSSWLIYSVLSCAD